jgi:hypothetical protein
MKLLGPEVKEVFELALSMDQIIDKDKSDKS